METDGQPLHPSPCLLLTGLSFTPEGASAPGVLLTSAGALRWAGEESPTPAQSPPPVSSPLQRPLAHGHQLTTSGARFTPRVRGPGSEAPGGAQEERTVPEAACGGRGEAIRRGAAQTSTVQPHACKEKARNLIRGRLRPKFQPQRGVTGWRPTGARQPTALSPFPSGFGSPGRRDHGESLTCRETSTHRPGGPASPASLCPASASKLGPQVAPLQPRTPDHAQPPRSRSRISLTGHGTHGCWVTTGALDHPRPWAPPKAAHSLSVSPCTARELGRQARGCEERKGLRGGRWLQIGAEPQMLGAGGAVSPGPAVEEAATGPPETPLGLLGPGAPLPGAPRRALPTPSLHPGV